MQNQKLFKPFQPPLKILNQADIIFAIMKAKINMLKIQEKNTALILVRATTISPIILTLPLTSLPNSFEGPLPYYYQYQYILQHIHVTHS